MANYTITQILDKTTQIEVYTSAVLLVTIPKASVKLKLDGDIVYLYDSSQSAINLLQGENQVYTLDFNSITSPVSASAVALVNNILTILNAGMSSGDATAANQVLQTTALNSILAKIIPAPATAALQGSQNNNLSSILGQLDITQTALANLLKGTGNRTLTDLFTTLNDIDAYTQGVYSAVNVLSTRVSANNCTSVSFPATATLALQVTAVNAFLGGTAVHLIGDPKYVQNILGTYEAYLTYSNV